GGAGLQRVQHAETLHPAAVHGRLDEQRPRKNAVQVAAGEPAGYRSHATTTASMNPSAAIRPSAFVVNACATVATEMAEMTAAQAVTPAAAWPARSMMRSARRRETKTPITAMAESTSAT